MDKELNSSKNLNTEFTNKKDSNDYQNLIERFMSIKESITLLEKNIFLK